MGCTLADGVSPFTYLTCVAYQIEGCVNTQISRNTGRGVNPLYSGVIGIVLAAFSDGSISTTPTTFSDISNNHFDGLYSGGSEIAGETDNNYITMNTNTSGSFNFLVTGANTYFTDLNTTNGLYSVRVPTSFVDGDAVSPGIRRYGQSNVGIYFATNTVGLTIGSSATGVALTSTAFVVSQQIRAVLGSVSSPSFTFSSDTAVGLYRGGNATLGVACSGTTPLLVGASAVSSSVHFRCSSIPTIAAGAGAGTTPTISITGSDQGFSVTLTVGTPSATGNIFTVTFGKTWDTAAPSVTFSAGNANAAALSGTSAPYILDPTTTTMVFVSGSVALTAATTYIWRFTAI